MALENTDEHILAVLPAGFDQQWIKGQGHLAVSIITFQRLKLRRHQVEVYVEEINGVQNIRIRGVRQTDDLVINTGPGLVDELQEELFLIRGVPVGILSLTKSQRGNQQ